MDIKEAGEVVASAVVLTYGATFADHHRAAHTHFAPRARMWLLVLAPIMMAGLLMVGYTVVTGSAVQLCQRDRPYPSCWASAWTAPSTT